MTRREAISNVKTGLKLINADTHYTNKQIWTILEKHSKWLIKRESDAFKLYKLNSILQTYSCAEVINVPKIDPCCGLTTKCTIKRTKDKIPLLYEDSNGVLINSVKSIDNSVKIDSSNELDYPKRKNNPFSNKNTLYYFYKDGYIYGDLPKKINIRGFYSDDISKYNICNSKESKENKCIRFLDRKWNIPDYLEAQIIDFTIKELGVTLNIPNQERIDKNENKP